MAAALGNYHTDPRAVVLVIVRGGVPAAFEVAGTLHLPLDLVLVRPLVSRVSGVLLRAACVAGTLLVDKGCDELHRGSVEGAFVSQALDALVARDTVCRGTRPPARLEQRTIIWSTTACAPARRWRRRFAPCAR